MQFQCTKCGKMHQEWPAITFDAPYNYYALSETDREKYVKELSDDFCVIEYEDQTDRFIRAVLFQEVIDGCQDLHYGIWVSLSEKSFDEYNENFFSDDQEGTYFGYLCSEIPNYNSTTSIKTNVILAKNRQRPEVIPHKDQMENEFVQDYWNGITQIEAERRIAEALNNG